MAINLPLLEDEEREAVGKAYRQSGQAAAIALGQSLVSGELRARRIQRWIAFREAHPDALLYCFRGGLRSRVAQQWLWETGIEIPRIDGGYKAMRSFLIDSINTASQQCEFMLIAGKTGCGKTALLEHFDSALDLEGIANHRGSAFGTRLDPQPGQIDFENRLAIALLRLPFQQFSRILLEDESRAIGSLSIPIVFHDRMKTAPIAVIEESPEFRVQTILDDYISQNYQELLKQQPLAADQLFSDYLFSSLKRIQKRLGTSRYLEVRAEMELALRVQQQNGDLSVHNVWIGKLLQHYYDPMYNYQLGRKSDRIVFRGNTEEFLAWAESVQFTRDGSDAGWSLCP